MLCFTWVLVIGEEQLKLFLVIMVTWIFACCSAKKEKSLTHNPRNLTQTVSSRGSDQPLRKANWAELQSDDLTSPQRPSSFNVSSEFPGHAGKCELSTDHSLY